jgi:hypothetical protein
MVVFPQVLVVGYRRFYGIVIRNFVENRGITIHNIWMPLDLGQFIDDYAR